ncbi:MAG TPA: hypothetical protein VN493_06830 [Thermoanaerobaculia bacterium]|nr:hypothetical protein [Thermoanaerobaculia bacterium]
MDPTLATILAAIIGGVATVVAAWLAHRQKAADARLSRIEVRLDALSAKIDLLLQGPREPFVRIGNLDIPQPALDLRVGWVDVVTTTVEAPSLSAITPSKVAVIFETITHREALVNAVLRGDVAIQALTLTRDWLKRIGGPQPAYAARLEIVNNTGTKLKLEIPKGQVFENAVRHLPVQNLAVAEATVVTCGPHEFQRVDIPAYCLNEKLKNPRGSDGRIAPLKIRFSFTDQESLWREVQARTK